jgi:two-component system response regulator NreC
VWRQALSAGALGYVLKEAADDELVEAVRNAAGRGELPAPATRGADGPRAATRTARRLSEREVNVLWLIALGHTNAEIGEQLYLSVRTVETHRSHIQQKLRLSTRAELVGYALKRGLISGAAEGD